MKTSINLFLILFIVTVISCGSTPSKANNSATAEESHVEVEYPIVINPKKKHKKKSLKLSDIAEVTHIPLHTSHDVLLPNMLNGLSVSDSLIITLNQTGTVFVFGRNGDIKSQFNRKGKSAQEYQGSISKIAVDFAGKEIYIYDYALRYRIQVYSLTGEFKRTLAVSQSFFVNDFTDYDEKHLLVYMTQTPSDIKTKKGSFQPYYLMSKNNGSCHPLNITVPEIKDGKIRQTKVIDSKHSRSRMVGFRTSPIVKNGKDVFISDFACDTIYSFRDNVLTPFIVMKPSLQDPDETIFAGISLKTTRYTFLSIVMMKKESVEFNQQFLTIDHKTGEIFEPDFVQDNFGYIPDNYFRNLPVETSAISLSALRLVEENEKGVLSGTLKDIASKIKEDDNPVLMLIQFKK